jgi:hypothetical protein
MPCSVPPIPCAPVVSAIRRHPLISAEGKVARLEACRALLPPEAVELGAQREAAVAAARPVSAEVVAAAVAAVPVAQPEAAVVAVVVAEERPAGSSSVRTRTSRSV